MPRLDLRNIQFSAEAAQTGQKKMRLSNMIRLGTGPVASPEHLFWQVDVENLSSEPATPSIQVGPNTWWFEMGWNPFPTFAGFEKRTVQGSSMVPAEMGMWGAGTMITVHEWGFQPSWGYPSIGLPMEALQRDGDLIPAGQPLKYPVWSGLREMPVPYSAYAPAVYFDRIAMPMLSRSQPTVGKLKVMLLSPSDNAQWPTYSNVCEWSRTEMRCGSSRMKDGPGPYQYDIKVGILPDMILLKNSLWGAKVPLTDIDSSGMFSFDMNFPPVGQTPGQYQLAVYIVMHFPGVAYDTHPMFWGVDQGLMLCYPTVGYVNVVN
jgi:hypothetical protein